MARIAGVDIPREKRLEISLTYIFGVGLPTSQKMCAELNLDPNTKVSNLTEDEVNQIRSYIDQNLKIEGDLRRDVQGDIKRKIEIGCLQASGIAKACPFAVSAPTPTLVPARARSARWPTRRRQSASNGQATRSSSPS